MQEPSIVADEEPGPRDFDNNTDPPIDCPFSLKWTSSASAE